MIDIVQVTFDLRALQAEEVLAQRNVMGMGVDTANQMNSVIMAQQAQAQQAAVQQAAALAAQQVQ